MLYLIPTPIGNLEDISIRALRLLKEVDLLLVEDTRKSGRLLKHFEVATPMRPYHAHNEHQSTPAIVEQLQGGATYGLITDAGTPGISDPGFLLVRACAEAGVAVQCLPGATAFVPALAIAGIPNNRFYFEGFLPHKKGRKTRLSYLADSPETFVLYESPYRLVKCLKQLAEHCGEDRQAAVCRELTKLHEECQRGSLAELQAYYETNKPKGEIVIVVSGRPA